MENLSKTCRLCNLIKEIGEFYVAPSNKDRLQHQCKDCVKALSKVRRIKNGDEIRCYDRMRYQRDKEKRLALCKKRVSEKREEVRDYQKNYYQIHKEKLIKKSRQWAIDNPVKRKLQHQARRALKRNAAGSFTQEQWEDIKRHKDYRCLRCGEQEPYVKLTVDHIKPLIKGGTNYAWNIQPLCFSCNAIKGVKEEDYRYLMI